jgi:hypothetical protein
LVRFDVVMVSPFFLAMTPVTQRAAGGHEENANLNVAPPAVDAMPRISNNTRRAILFRSF